MKRVLIAILLLVSCPAWAGERISEELLKKEVLTGAPLDAMRLDDALRSPNVFAQGGGDLIQEFVRFLFPINGREQRTMFIPLSFWGKKKPQYKKFEWKRFESDHFNFYAYPDGEEVLQSVISFLEEEHERNNRIFGVENRFTKKIPVIFYQTRRDFEQSTVLEGPVPEGLEGVTELFSWKRATFPFEGEQAEIEHVAKHEGTHIYQIAKGARKLPLWFIEGSAETNSVKWDADAEMTIRDAYLNGVFFHLEDLWQIDGTWLMYKEGNFICNLIWDEYGEQGFKKIFDRSASMSFSDNIKESLGISMEELDRKIFAELARRYSSLLGRKDILDGALKVDKEKVLLHARGSFYLSGGTSGPRQALFINYVSPQGKVTRKKITEDRRYENESLNYFRKGAWFSESRIAYAIRRSRQDVIRILDYSFDDKKMKFNLGPEMELSWPNISILAHPVLVGKTQVAFVGYVNGFSDLYSYDWTNKKLSRLTSDRKHYADLDYSSVRNELAFSREDERSQKNRLEYDRNLYTYNLLSGQVSQITMTPTVRETQPRFSPDGKRLMYLSDANETYDLFSYSFESKTSMPLTRMKVGTRNAQWSTDQSLFLNGFEILSPSIFYVPVPTRRVQLQADFPEGQGQKVTLDQDKFTLKSPSGIVVKPEPKLEDGLHFIDKKGVLFDQGEPLQVEEFAAFHDRLVLSARHGKPGEKRVETDESKYYYLIQGKKLEGMASKTFAHRDVPPTMRNNIREAMDKRELIDAWWDRERQRVLVVVNNRLANESKKFKKKPAVSFAIYDVASNSIEELPKGPVEDVSDRIQWVVFLEGGKILIALGISPQGPFQLLMFDDLERRFFEVEREADQFRVTPDRTEFTWRSGASLYRWTSKDRGQHGIKGLASWSDRNVGFEYLSEGKLLVFLANGKKWLVQFVDSAGMAAPPIEIEHDMEFQFRGGAIDPETGRIAIVGRKKVKSKRWERIWMYDPASKKLDAVTDEGVAFLQPVFRHGYFLFTEEKNKPQPNAMWVFKDGKKVELEAFRSGDKLQTQALVLEGKSGLTLFDPNQKEERKISDEVYGYSLNKDSVYYSSALKERFQIFRYDMKDQKSHPISSSDTDEILPSVSGDTLRWASKTKEGWEIRQMSLAAPQKISSYSLSGYDVVNPEASTKTAEAFQKSTKRGAEPANTEHLRYPRLLKPEMPPIDYQIQSLTAGAAYDGSDFRFFISGYADNLFSDHGIFMQSVFIGDTRYGTIGFTDLTRGESYSYFYNSHDNIKNSGLNYSKNFILDRYRSISLFSSFEIQDYGLATADTIDFVTPDIESRTFYVAKAGSIFAYDETVWDSHGPVSGSRFFFQTGAGYDMGNGALANIDAILDYRLYHQLLPRFGFAHRIVAGTSQGDLPIVFLLGGNWSFRGVGFDELKGQNYWAFSEDVRVPVFDFVGAKFFDPLDQMLGFFTRYFDVRGGIYTDVGGAWFNHANYDTVYSVGYFVNVPTIFGFQFRFNQGFAGRKAIGIWFGGNW